MPPEIRAVGIEGMPEVRAGDDLSAQIMDAAAQQGTPIEEGDVLVVTQKIVSKAEGRVMTIDEVEASPLAVAITEGHRRDPRHTEMILRESRRLVRMDRGVIISETYHGYICANAGIDASNIPGANAICLLPVDPDASAQRIRDAVRQRLGVDVAVLVSDTFGRPLAERSDQRLHRGGRFQSGRELRGRIRPPRQRVAHYHHRGGRRTGGDGGVGNRQAVGCAGRPHQGVPLRTDGGRR